MIQVISPSPKSMPALAIFHKRSNLRKLYKLFVMQHFVFNLLRPNFFFCQLRNSWKPKQTGIPFFLPTLLANCTAVFAEHGEP